jgi:hypothetical protein
MTFCTIFVGVFIKILDKNDLFKDYIVTSYFMSTYAKNAQHNFTHDHYDASNYFLDIKYAE